MSGGEGTPPPALAVQMALATEAKGLRRAFYEAAFPLGGADAFEARIAGWRAVVAVSGLGRVRAEATARALLEACRPRALLVTGVAGALDPTLRTGQIVVSRRVRCAPHAGWRCPGRSASEVRCDEGLVEAACEALRACGLHFVAADCATVEQPIMSVREKREAWNHLGVGIVDMEGYWAGRVAWEHGVPFLVVRAVLDRASAALPAFVRGWRGPEDSAMVIRSLLGNPCNLPRALLLHRRLVRAANGVTTFLLAFASSQPFAKWGSSSGR